MVNSGVFGWYSRHVSGQVFKLFGRTDSKEASPYRHSEDAFGLFAELSFFLVPNSPSMLHDAKADKGIHLTPCLFALAVLSFLEFKIPKEQSKLHHIRQI